MDNDILKKTEHNSLVPQVNAIHINGFVLKTQYNSDKSGLEKKIHEADKKIIPDTIGLVKKTGYNAKITEFEDKIRSVTS